MLDLLAKGILSNLITFGEGLILGRDEGSEDDLEREPLKPNWKTYIAVKMATSDGVKLDAGVVELKRAEGLILILDTPKGRGVFAGRDIPAGTQLDVCPVLVLNPVENEEHVRKTDLYNYTYNWPMPNDGEGKKVKNTQAVIFGIGSMFNHSARRQNVGWTRDIQNKVVVYTTLQDVKKGEELCISYGDRLTFVDAEVKVVDSDDEDEDAMLGRMETDLY